jgi:hypothetical protein
MNINRDTRGDRRVGGGGRRLKNFRPESIYTGGISTHGSEEKWESVIKIYELFEKKVSVKSLPLKLLHLNFL